MESRTRRILEGQSCKRKIGTCGSSMLRPSPNHGTLWLHNDDDDDDDVDDDDINNF